MMLPALYLPTGQKLCDLEDVSEFIRCFRKLSRMMLQEFIWLFGLRTLRVIWESQS